MIKLFLCILIITPSLCFAYQGHECGIAMVRLRKPLTYYQETYGSAAWGLDRLCQLMASQRNRGRNGAGFAVVKFDMPAGHKYMQCMHSANDHAIQSLFRQIARGFVGHREQSKLNHPFLGEAYLGHVRSSICGSNISEYGQPSIFKSNLASKQCALAGDFHMTNADTLCKELIDRGISLTNKSEMHLILEHIRYHLNQEHAYLATKISYQSAEPLGGLTSSQAISDRVNSARVLQSASRHWDGGYVFGGLLGNGDLFICRDPFGIRPGFYYIDDDVFAAASERSALCAVFGCSLDAIHPIPPGSVITLKRSGTFAITPFTAPQEERQCILERIYFSHPSDPGIYQERKKLGMQLAQRVLDLVSSDRENTFFTYIPNSSDIAFEGFIQEIQHILSTEITSLLIENLQRGRLTPTKIKQLCDSKLRTGRLLYKNPLMFRSITEEILCASTATGLYYDTSKGIVKPTDTLVVLDDLIIHGTTLRESIIPQLIALNPKQIIIVSSAPPIKYPDSYSTHIHKIETFIAFQAAVQIHQERGNQSLLEEMVAACSEYAPGEPIRNQVKKLYDSITHEELEAKIAQLIRPATAWSGTLTVVYQRPEELRLTIPHHTGDWVFSGDYPTPGGYQMVNQSFVYAHHLMCTKQPYYFHATTLLFPHSP